MTARSEIKVVPPGGVVGILGGGQLGRMLSMAAARLGLDVHILAPESDTPAGRVSAECLTAAYDDESALIEFASRCNVVTIEFENIPSKTLEFLQAQGTPVFPNPKALDVSQDRLSEKEFLSAISVPPVPFEAIDAADQIAPALERLGGKGVLKLRREGYDGKGQLVIETGCNADNVFRELRSAPCVLERFTPFIGETSVIIARAQDGVCAMYEPPRNEHGGGILHRSTVPSGFTEGVEVQARAHARKLAESLDYVGVLALEFFVMEDGSLYANEFAPRVHNSGHWTDDACYVSQFEQHIRAVCGWPLGPTTRHSNVEMLNLLGDEDIDQWSDRAAQGEAVRIYGKRGGGSGRKLGHVNRLTPLGG